MSRLVKTITISQRKSFGEVVTRKRVQSRYSRHVGFVYTVVHNIIFGSKGAFFDYYFFLFSFTFPSFSESVSHAVSLRQNSARSRAEKLRSRTGTNGRGALATAIWHSIIQRENFPPSPFYVFIHFCLRTRFNSFCRECRSRRVLNGSQTSLQLLYVTQS